MKRVIYKWDCLGKIFFLSLWALVTFSFADSVKGLSAGNRLERVQEVGIIPTESRPLSLRGKSFVVIVIARDFTKASILQLESILNQDFDHYRVIYIADGWKEEEIQAFEQLFSSRQEINFFRNKEPRGHLACMCQAVFSCNPEEIVVEVTGATLWRSPFILTQLNLWYENSDFWMSCGPSGKEVMSFYAGLFHQIHKEDFLEEIHFVSENDTLCYLLPILKMSQKRAYHVSSNGAVFEFLINGGQVLSAVSPLTTFLKPQLEEEDYVPLEELPLGSKETFAHEWVENFRNPTLQDYRALQKGLTFGERKNLERLEDMLPLMRNVKLIGESITEIPVSGIVNVNCKEEDRECCVLVYATFNRNYPRGLRRLLDRIINSDFKGHVLYRLGGWPDVEGGSLSLAHVPYGFKPAFFREAQRMGFKRVLWLDVAVLPIVSLNTIFEMIREKGYFVMGNAPHCVGSFMHPCAAAYFGLTLAQTQTIPSCSAGLFGLDFTRPFAHRLFEDWYRAALDEDAFFSKRSDQNALSILLDRYGLYELTDIRKMPHVETGEVAQEGALFYLDRMFVQ